MERSSLLHKASTFNNVREGQIGILLAGKKLENFEILGRRIAQERNLRQVGLVCDPEELSAALRECCPDVLLISAGMLVSLPETSDPESEILRESNTLLEIDTRVTSVPTGTEGGSPDKGGKSGWLYHPFLTRIVYLFDGEQIPQEPLLKMGASDILCLPQDLESLNRIIISAYSETQERKIGVMKELRLEKLSRGLSSTILTFWGAKGGVGTTKLATSASRLLSHIPSYRPLFIDLDLQLGDAGQQLGAVIGSPKATIADLVAIADELSRPTIENAIISCGGNVLFLPPPHLPEEAELVTPEHIHLLLPVLKNWYDPVVIDLPSGFSNRALAALDHTDILLMVTSPDISSLRNADRMLGALDRMGFDRARASLVINGYRSRSVWPSAVEIESTLGTRVAGTIPWDRKINTTWPDSQNTSRGATRGRFWRSLSDLLGEILEYK